MHLERVDGDAFLTDNSIFAARPRPIESFSFPFFHFDECIGNVSFF